MTMRARRVDVYLGTRRVLWAAASAPSETEDGNPRSWAVSDVDEAMRVLDELLEDPRRSDFRLWLSGGLMRPFLLEAPPKTSARELKQIAASLAPERTGLDGECEVWVEPRRATDEQVAVAVRAAQLNQILERFNSARSPQHRLLSLGPWWSEVLRFAGQSHQDAQMLAVQDCDSLTLLAGALERFSSIQTLSPMFDRATAEAAVMRKLLTLDAGDRQETVVRSGFRDAAVDTADDPAIALAPWVEVSA